MNPVQPDPSNPAARDEPQNPASRNLTARAPAARGPAYTHGPGSRVLAGYVIKRGLGQGGFGEVYYAVSDAGKDVALKLVRRNLEVELRGVMQCLNVKHPNLIALYDVRVDAEENHWIVMEYVAGERLTDIIERSAEGMPPAEAIAILRGIGAGVGYLHQAGIVHRDLKPANIFVENGFVKIGDYGLSKFISSSRRSGQTESVGTVHYMAPEIANGRYGKQIDIYALGILFYELLTGRLPFDGESVGEILMKHLLAEPDLTPLAEPYRSAIGAALKKDPEQRPKTVEAFLHSIDPTTDAAALVATAPKKSLAADPTSLGARPARRRSLETMLKPGPRSAGPERFMRKSIGPAIVVALVLGSVFKLGHVLQSVPWFFSIAALAVLLTGGASAFLFVRNHLRRSDASGEGLADGKRLSLRATEAFPGREAPGRFGRRAIAVVSACAFVLCLLMMTFVGIRNAERSKQLAIAERAEYEALVKLDPARARLPQLSTPSAPSISGRKLAALGVVSVVAIGAVVGLTLAIGRKARAVVIADDERVTQVIVPVEANDRPALRPFAIDATGSLLLLFGASLIVVRLLLLLLVDQPETTTYLWASATTFTAVALTTLVIKGVRYLDRESASRRLMFFFVGIATGAASWGYAEYLGFGIPFQDGSFRTLLIGVKPESWPECYVSGRPSYPAYMGYFGFSFLLVDWWGMTLPKRTSRWRVGDVFVAVFWAGVVQLVFPFPQPWGMLVPAGSALLLPFAFPLPRKSGVRIARRTFA
ncbi:MAG: serine/threonine protein kinase [Planctomycetia bacterium]|nr:serine/threonine protein kinase [Planctomycetia bacterium]